MTKTPSSIYLTAALLAAFLAAGCNPATTSAPPPPNPTPPGQGRGLKSVMSQIGKGPASLWSKINPGLNVDPPAWDDLRPQTDKLASLAAEVGDFQPRKGQDTWAQDAKAFADEAAGLNAAVKDHDRDKAKMIQIKLRDACGACHKAHGGPPGIEG